ncbi:hypothetical protein V0242_11715 [Aeromonas hydrophila]|uniref:hypothetical protein n=1 Tax=Aeromonas hydrophila TaxID=644 RepID=UPI002ED02A4F|nr:hypothetical protein V0242_11715 [Aeromonas hydrophila]
MIVDIYKAKKGYVFVKTGDNPADHVPANIGFGRLIKKNHDSSAKLTGNPINPNEAADSINTKGYYHSSAGVNIGESQSIQGPLDKNNPPRS